MTGTFPHLGMELQHSQTAGIQYIGEQIKPDLADGNYLDAFETYGRSV